MSRMLSLVVSLMLLLTLGLAQAPRVCSGDGQGGACQPAACACVSTCSCHPAHQRELAEAATPDCCVVEQATSPSSATACHGPDSWPHFAPQDKHWDAIAPMFIPAIAWGYPAPARAGAIALLTHRATAPPEKPPRAA